MTKIIFKRIAPKGGDTMYLAYADNTHGKYLGNVAQDKNYGYWTFEPAWWLGDLFPCMRTPAKTGFVREQLRDDLRKVIGNEYREACTLLEVRYEEVSEHALSRMSDAQGRLSFCKETAEAFVNVAREALGLAKKSVYLYSPGHEEAARRVKKWTEFHVEAREHKEELAS